MPYYKWEEFVSACNLAKTMVFVDLQAGLDAKEEFNLPTKAELLDYIAANELKDMVFVNSKPWRRPPCQFGPLCVDAYTFQELLFRGYLAFGYSEATGRWALKSFHIDRGNHEAEGIESARTRAIPGERYE